MLEITDLTVGYSTTPIIERLTVALADGRLTGVIGANGAGKSTLLKTIVGLIPVRSGRILYHDRPIRENQRQIGYVAQHAAIDTTFPITVRETVLLGAYPRLGWGRQPSRQDRLDAEDALAAVELTDLGERPLTALSGGQRQRVYIARAILQDAPLVLLDEPFAGIDVHSEAVIMAILRQWRAAGKTVLVVHHDLNKVRQYFDDLLILAPGRGVIDHGQVNQVFTPANIAQAFSPDMESLFNAPETEVAQ
ncbi:metal ABC transporter ATP-binding protein [Schleiferilactobacillus shenzhenensis]|nr:metal ABC transporter ATP-binding protein [Schleiferilactobacillus shenzhenensis]